MDTIVKVLNEKVENGDAKTIVEALKQIDPNAEGETVAEVLKNMNIGGEGGGAFIVNYVYGEEVDTLDKTYAEIKSAFLSGKTIYILVDNSYDNPEYGYTQFEYYIVTSLSEKVGQESGYHVLAKNWDFASATEDGVLTLSD